MAFGYNGVERAELEARARAILEACPDVGSFIRRGLSDNPDRDTLVYLRTALDPAPVTTRAGEFLGFIEATRLWLRLNGVGPGDVVAILAPNVTATSIAYWAAVSSAIVQPLNLLFTRDAIAAQLDAVKAKIVFAPPPGAPGGLHEKGPKHPRAGAQRRTHRRVADGRPRRLRRGDARARRPAPES